MKKQTKVKRLYKRFDIELNNMGTKVLIPPYAYGSFGRQNGYMGTPRNSKRMVFLTPQNAEGFVSPEIVGELVKCANGFHAFEAQDYLTYSIRVVNARGTTAWYEIELYKCVEAGVKWVGRSFKILKRIPVKTLAKLCTQANKKVKK